MADAAVIPGAEWWSARGTGERGEVGVLVVHGFTGNPITTRPLGERLAAAGFTVEVPRLPGHGTTVADMRRRRYADWLATVDRCVDQLQSRCRAVVVGGLSMGGLLTLDVATRRDLAGIVTVNAPIVLPRNPLLPVLPLLAHLVPYVPPAVAGIAEDDIRRPGVTEQAYARVPVGAIHSLARAVERVRGRLGHVRAPALVVNSAEDHTVDPGDAEVIAAGLGSPDVRRMVLHDSYHVATLDHDRDLLAEAVVGFVADVTAS